MTTRLAAVALLVCAAATATSAVARAGPAPRVDLDRSSAAPTLGRHLSFTSRIQNPTDRPLDGLIAHLNVVALDRSVYVDPEDWSSSRTRYLSPVPPGASTPVTWTVQAVNSGRFDVYVTVLAGRGGGEVAVSRPLLIEVAERRTLNAGGVVPLVLAVPASVLLLGYAVRRGGRRGTAQRSC